MSTRLPCEVWFGFIAYPIRSDYRFADPQSHYPRNANDIVEYMLW